MHGTLIYNNLQEHTMDNQNGLELLFIMNLVDGCCDHKWQSYEALKVKLDLLHHFCGSCS